MKVLNKITNIIALLLIVVVQFVVMLPVPKAYAYANPATVNLGTVDSFAAFAADALGDTGSASLIVGNVGLTPGGGTSYTGILSGNVTGIIYAVDGAGPVGSTNNPGLLTTARADLNTAYTNAMNRTPNLTLNAGDNQLGGQNLTQGVYAVAAASTANLIGTLTLTGDADSIFIFQMSSTLVTAASSKVVLAGVQSCHVFWQVGSSATLNATTTFVGTVMADTTITNTGAAGSTVDGRLLAGAITGSGALTLNHNNITKPTCAAAASSTSSSTSTSGGKSTGEAYCVDLNYIPPTIISSKRIDADSITLNWGPYSGTDKFIVQYGLENNKWLYSTNVTGFSTTLNALPANQPMWVRIGITSNCSAGNYGASMLVGGPKLPNTGFAPRQSNLPWYISTGILVAISAIFISIQRKHRSS